MDALFGGECLIFGGFRLEPRTGRLFRQDATGEWVLVPIGSRAMDILCALLKSPDAVVSKDAIMDAVWPGVAVEPNNLTVQIAALRRILDEGRGGEGCIQTVPGRGYKFVLGVTQAAKTQSDMPPVPAVAPLAAPEVRARPDGPIRRWRIAAAGSVAMIALLLVAVWHGSWFSTAPVPPRLSLVVLPFENIGSDATDDYLATGITHDLTTALSHIPGAIVIARATAYTYRGRAEDIRGIGRDLGVRYVVNGSVQRLGTVLRLNVELGSTETGAHLWSDSFDQKIADLAAGQEQIVIRMRAALHIDLLDIEAARSLRERPTDPDAYDLILRARAIAILPATKDRSAKVLALHEQALARDPDAVVALVGAAGAVTNLYYLDAMPYEPAMDRVVHYIERARTLEPNSEVVLGEYANVLDFQQEGLDWRRARSELEAVARKLIDYFPNNPQGYHELGVVRRNQGRYEECVEPFERAIRLDPRGAAIASWSFSMAYCKIFLGHDREALAWADRSIAAGGTQQGWWQRRLLAVRAAAYFRTGDLASAKSVARELNDRFPGSSWRSALGRLGDPDSPENVAEYRSLQDALKAAGTRDHVDPDADFQVAPVDVLHLEFNGKTPTTAPGVTTVSTERLVSMLRDTKPLVIDTMAYTWYRSIPGAVGLDFNSKTDDSFTDETQKRLKAKLRELTGGNMTKPIAAVGWNSASFDGYNLALRLRHAGYTNVYWYRGGREAWEVAGKPEEETRPADW